SIGRELGTTIQRMVHEKDLIQRNEELEAAYEELAGSEEELRHQYDLLAKTAENHQKTIDLLENLIAIAHFPIIVWDSDFNIIRMNHIIERIIGRSAAECVGSSVQSVFLPSQAEHVRRLLETTQSGVKWENVELPVLHQDGTLRTILWNTSTLFDTDGITPIATLAQGNDVTDERRYATEKDAALVEIQKNIAQLAILNDEIRNPLMVIITCADLLGNDELLDQIMVQAQRIDGMVNSLVSRDITARKEAEAVIRENEKRYREIFESLEDLYYETDENGIITVLSPSVRFSGWTAEELIGTPVQELYVHPEDRSLLLSELSKNGFVKDFELLLRKKDGTPIPISLSGSIIERPDGTKGGLRGSLRDITERKQAEQKLISTFQTFQDIVKSIPSGIFIYTFEEPDRLILADGNQEAERLTGITIQDWIGREFNEIWPGARESGLTDAYLNAYHTGILFETEDLYYQDERLRGAFRIKAFPIPENRFVVAFEDVTDKKSYELALAESERNYREIFNSTSEAIMIDDASTGKIIDVNETTLKMYGYDTKEEILAGNIGDLSANIFPYDEAEAQRRIEKCIKEGPQVFEWLAKKKSGENFWVEVSLRRSEIGGRGRILAVVRDITRRKEAEESLRMMNERLLQIDSSTLDAIYAYDNQGRFTHANRALCELLGLSRDEIIGKTHRELGFSEDICNEWDKLHTEVYDSDSTITRETVTPIKNGQDMYFEVILNPIHDETGKIVGISGLTRNITDRKKAEEALYASNQKLRLLTSLTRHDVTNKLTAIQLFHEACLEENDLVKKNEFITFASQATQEAEAIIRFTREYEDFGSVSSRWQQVESLIHHASSEILHNGIVIETRTLTNIQIYADPIIQKVFSTLIENAIRHGADITRIIFTCMPKGQDIIIVCEDDGCGIPVHEKEKIFDHGFGKNTGLGLFLAREILAITGLTIRETGMPGKGARFEILVLEGKWQRM
ncbi:PAS domain S-box protein, partial [Methanospirillum hungatei]|uniref:PAS domain S-box protein n=1 Tax=Methanospirillum hungatei TaxID=2203 RepID=UPI0026F35DE3